MTQRLFFFFAFLAQPGEVLPGCSVSPGYSFRQTPRSIPEVGCQPAPVPLNCGASSPHQVLSEVLRVKPEKQGPPAAPPWAWCSGEGSENLHRANRPSSNISVGVKLSDYIALYPWLRGDGLRRTATRFFVRTAFSDWWSHCQTAVLERDHKAGRSTVFVHLHCHEQSHDWLIPAKAPAVSHGRRLQFTTTTRQYFYSGDLTGEVFRALGSAFPSYTCRSSPLVIHWIRTRLQETCACLQDYKSCVNKLSYFNDNSS